MTGRMSGRLYYPEVSDPVVFNNCLVNFMPLTSPILLLKLCYPMLRSGIVVGDHAGFGPENLVGMAEQGYREFSTYLIATALVVCMRMGEYMLMNGDFPESFPDSGIGTPYSGVYQYTFDNIAVDTVSWHQWNL